MLAAADARLAAWVDVGASITASASCGRGGPWKPADDLQRYAWIIATTRPEVVVETGTHTGASANWFAAQGVDVITVDNREGERADDPRITWLVGDSTDPAVTGRVRELVDGRRCMVSLDSDHSAAHVTTEIDAYAGLVSPGCYLVVEDTIWAWADDRTRRRAIGDAGTPLDAVQTRLLVWKPWVRDSELESRYRVSNSPAGWWLRRA